MRLIVVLVALAVAVPAAPARAQGPVSPVCAAPIDGVPTPTDFRVCGQIDQVVPADGSPTLTTTTPVGIGAWVFECRSGLQPATQRLGTITALWWRMLGPQHGEVDGGPVTTATVAVRADVAAAYQSLCPAMGAAVGLNLTVPPPSEAGIWTLDLVVTTTDGAGRRIEWRGRREGLGVNW